MLAVDTTPLPRRRRAPGMLLVALLVGVACTVGILVAARRTVDHVERVPKVADVLSPADATVDNYLLVGSDSRTARDREARAADVWDERIFPGFLGAAVWNAIGLMAGGEQNHRGLEALKQWLRNSGYAEDRNFRGAFAVTLHLLRQAFGRLRPDDPWQAATTEAGVVWDLAVKGGRR